MSPALAAADGEVSARAGSVLPLRSCLPSARCHLQAPLIASPVGSGRESTGCGPLMRQGAAALSAGRGGFRAGATWEPSQGTKRTRLGGRRAILRLSTLPSEMPPGEPAAPNTNEALERWPPACRRAGGDLAGTAPCGVRMWPGCRQAVRTGRPPVFPEVRVGGTPRSVAGRGVGAAPAGTLWAPQAGTAFEILAALHGAQNLPTLPESRARAWLLRCSGRSVTLPMVPCHCPLCCLGPQ